MQDCMKEIHAMHDVAKETDGSKGVSLEGRAHGELEEIFQWLHAVPLAFSENLYSFDTHHDVL